MFGVDASGHLAASIWNCKSQPVELSLTYSAVTAC